MGMNFIYLPSMYLEISDRTTATPMSMYWPERKRPSNNVSRMLCACWWTSQNDLVYVIVWCQRARTGNAAAGVTRAWTGACKQLFSC